MNRPRKILLAAPVAALVALAATGCGGASDSSSASGAAPGPGGGGGAAQLALVAYSTPQVAYDEAIPAFQATRAGRGVSFSQSYGASGEQSRSVAQGLPADVVEFSLAPDMTRLVKAGIVAPTWDANAHKGFLTRSVVSLIVRKGNPKHIKGWTDLLRPGIEVVTPNPFTSGAARWNLLAAYGANGGLTNPAQGTDYLRRLITQHVKVQPKSGRDALQTFTSGTGDVLISYENEAITAQQKGQPVDYLLPSKTILIENPVAVTARSQHPQQAQAFLRFLWSPAGQRIFAKHGYRPVDPSVLRQFESRFPTPSGLFTIGDLGGWTKVDDALFDPEKGVVARIEQDAGVSTAS